MRSDESYVTSLGLEVLCLEIFWYFCCKQCLVDSRLWALMNILAVLSRAAQDSECRPRGRNAKITPGSPEWCSEISSLTRTRRRLSETIGPSSEEPDLECVKSKASPVSDLLLMPASPHDR